MLQGHASTFDEFPIPIFCPCSFLSLQHKELGYCGRLGKKVVIFCDKICLTGCKWSSLNDPGSYISWCHSLLESFPSHFLVYYWRLGKKLEFFWNKIGLKGWKWSSLNAPGSETPVSHQLFPISHLNPCRPQHLTRELKVSWIRKAHSVPKLTQVTSHVVWEVNNKQKLQNIQDTYYT